jgi:hypothetical protein
MCGIIGIIAREAVAPRLIEGLRCLEYRGYDSAGIATLVDGQIERRRAESKLDNLARRLDREPVHGVIGIGHTRWAACSFASTRRSVSFAGHDRRYRFQTRSQPHPAIDSRMIPIGTTRPRPTRKPPSRDASIGEPTKAVFPRPGHCAKA